MILAFGDCHLTKEPLRVLTVLNFLDYIKNYCRNNNIKNIVNLGDFFDRPELKSDAFVPVFKKLMELSEEFNLYNIIGNHELKDKAGTNTLVETFSSFGIFVQNSDTIEIDGYDYDFMSYTDLPDNIPNKSRVLFCHAEVEGFYYNPNRKIEGTYFKPEHFDQYNLVVSGHLHHEQNKNNFEFVGSPFPTNRGEGGKDNFFAIIDKDTVRLEKYNQGPDYITINAEEFNDRIDYNNKIVTVQLTKKVENFVKLRDILLERGALEILPEFVRGEETVDVSEHKIDASEGVVKSAAKFLNEVQSSDINNKKLLSCFKEVLKRCQR